MLASIDFNMNKVAEARGERGFIVYMLTSHLGAQYEYRYFSKAMGDYRTKTKKGPASHVWKHDLVDETYKTAAKYVPQAEEGDTDDLEFDGVEVAEQQLAELLEFEDSEDEDGMDA